MFIIKSLIEDLKIRLPDVWARDFMVIGVELEFVLKVSILDGLRKPVLCPGELSLGYRRGPCIKTSKEVVMFTQVISNVLIRHSLLEEAFLKYKVVMVLGSSILKVLFIVVTFNQKDSVKESTVFIINLWHFHSEAFVPSVWIRDRVDDPRSSEANSQEEKGHFGHV